MRQACCLTYLMSSSTNAIKFTKDQPERRIVVKLGGSWTRPPKVWQAVSFTSDDGSKADVFDQPGWGNGQKGYLWVKVTDTGCGMAKHEQEKLFSRFAQATPRTHVKYGGSGLGLFISKSLATLQGGAIGAFSESDVGSTFAFFVGTRRAHPPAEHVADRAPQTRPMPRRANSSEEAMKAVKLNVLIVEDNLVNQTVLKKQLQKFGWTISVAGNGQEALHWLKGSIYWQGEDAVKESRRNSDTPTKVNDELDVILMDVEMPTM